MADYVDVHFLKLYDIYMVSLCKKSNPMKSINKTNQIYRKYISLEKLLRPGQI